MAYKYVEYYSDLNVLDTPRVVYPYIRDIP